MKNSKFEQWYIEHHERTYDNAMSDATKARMFAPHAADIDEYEMPSMRLAESAFAGGIARANKDGVLRKAIDWILRNQGAHPNNVKAVCEDALNDVSEVMTVG